jgi:ssDNA-binding Zn-finger/Zn-ribbon topoisomerase 1
MDKLYIATSSLNFNSILATESISPEAFYENRNFGYKRFTKVKPNPFSNSIIAYSKIPVFKIEETDFDEYPLIVEISKNLIKEDSISNHSENNGVKIFQLHKTIYLHPSKVKFIFFNEKQQRTALIKVEPSIETKLLPVYKNAISLINKDSISFTWDKSFISQTSDLSDIKVFEQIGSDSKTNKLKGFYYSYLLGILISSSVKEKTLKEEFISISELILEFFNLKEKQSNSYNNIVDKLERLKLSINNSDGNKRVSKEELIKAKYLDKSNINEQSKLLDYLKGLKPDSKESVYQQLESTIEVSKNDILVLIDDLKEYLSKPYSKGILSLKTVRITKYVSELKKEEIKKTNPLSLIENLNFNGFRITQLSDSFFENNTAELYRNIVNDILDYPIYNIQTFKEEKINLAFKIGAILKEYIPNWQNSKERDYFNGLMDNIENYQPFDLKSHSSTLLQSIALFIQKGEEAEKLIDSLIKNQFSDYRISLGLWGSIFGFSALPKTITNLLFEKENIENTRKLYKDVQAKLHNSNSEVSLNIESVSKPQIKTKSVKQDPSNKEKKSSVIGQKPISPQQSNDNPKCPKCGGDMILRAGKFGKFYGCTKFSYNKETSCDGNLRLTANTSVPKKNAKFNNEDYCITILELIRDRKECSIKDLNNELKNKIESYSFNIGQAENYIKFNLNDKLELVKVGRSKGVKLRGNEMKFK